MKQKTALRICALLGLVAGGAIVSAQIQLPSAPPKGFGGSVTPAYEGWFDNPDGTHNFLIGYYSRNTEQEVDVAIGPNNRMEPGGPDMGQPTHFLTRRRFGMFVVTVPKDFGKTQKITWTLSVNGVTTSIPFHMHTDYNITPMKSSEESPDGSFNLPAQLRLEEKGPTFSGPLASVGKALTRTATVGVPMPLNLLVEDDARYSSGGSGPMSNPGPVVTFTLSKYRGPGEVKFSDPRAKLETLKGGKPMEPFGGKAAATATFSAPGDYMLHITANDYSGNGGGGSGCCWTTVIMKVAVAPGNSATRGQ